MKKQTKELGKDEQGRMVVRGEMPNASWSYGRWTMPDGRRTWGWRAPENPRSAWDNADDQYPDERVFRSGDRVQLVHPCWRAFPQLGPRVFATVLSVVEHAEGRLYSVALDGDTHPRSLRFTAATLMEVSNAV